ncbi:MAG: hypothetical protein LBI79_07315 [Nitrososphaerota archaeon]|jgi:hypothetical protein|nr:hypothetical protein [Nitrososphaerota archaeon]
MSQSEWKYINTVQKKIRVTRIEVQQRHVDAFDLEESVPICLIADKTVDLSKIKRAKIYQATVKVYETELTPELEQHVLESVMGDPQRFKAMQTLKASGTKPTKYELTALKH